MTQNNIKQTIDLIINNEVVSLKKIPDNLLEAWIVGISIKSDYNYERDFIINIFNDMYEGHKESQNINPTENSSERELYRARLEKLLIAERERRRSI